MTETATSPYLPGECDAPPRAIVVHDPVAAGAFHAFDKVGDDGRLEAALLFRGRPDPALYGEHHRIFVEKIAAYIDHVVALSDLVADDRCVANLAGNPNQVFTRDSLITLPWVPGGYFCARLKPLQRRGEAATMKAAVERLGLHEILRLPQDLLLEGGDVIPFVRENRRCLLVGYGPRSTLAAIDFLQEACLPDVADEIIAIELAPWRMNLDGGFVPVAGDVVVCDRESILSAQLVDPRGRRDIDIWALLGDLGIAVIDTTPEESVYAQSCNCLCLGRREIIYYDLCPRIADLLARHDIRVHLIPGTELIKGRGGPRCMTRPIY